MTEDGEGIFNQKALDEMDKELAKTARSIRRLKVGWWVMSTVIFFMFVVTGIVWWLAGNGAAAITAFIFAALNALYIYNVHILNKVNQDLRDMLARARADNLRLILGQVGRWP
jgi:Ca2+-dependent lipid-binding protein